MIESIFTLVVALGVINHEHGFDWSVLQPKSTTSMETHSSSNNEY